MSSYSMSLIILVVSDDCIPSISRCVCFFFRKELDQVESKGISLGKLQMTRKIGRTVNGSLVVFNHQGKGNKG